MYFVLKLEYYLCKHTGLKLLHFLGELLMIPRLVDTQVAILIAVDFDGNRRNMGGDPVTVKLIGPIEDTRQEGTLTTLAIEQQGNKSSNNMRIIDLKNGQYSIRLCLSVCGR